MNPYVEAFARMSAEEQRAIRSGHAHFRGALPGTARPELTKNQRKAERRRAKGKR